MPIPSGLKAKIDGRLSLMLTHLEARQDAYFASKGRYWQGIRTHAVLPKSELEEETPPDPTRKPTDQAEDWNDAGIVLPANMPMALVIDVYEGSLGHGWSTRVEVEYQDRIFARSKAYGPEAAHRTQGWIDVTPEELT